LKHLKVFLPLGFLFAPGLIGQVQVAPETVVASINGKPVTAGDLRKFVNGLPPQLSGVMERDPKEFARQYALMQTLAKIAQDEKLDQQSPYAERLEYGRLNLLTQSLIERKLNAAPVSDQELKDYYEKNKSNYSTIYSKVLYLSFGPDGKPRTEADAKTKIDDLRTKAKTGGDFVALIKENSEDSISRDKDGEYPIIRRNDQIPDPVKNALFGTAVGEYTEPIKVANGFYLFRVEKKDAIPMAEVKDNMIGAIRQNAFNAWFQNVRQGIDVKFENEAFFSPSAAPAGVAKPPGTQPEIKQ
jgi:peptidyl-prolyl cis-trans isomerase C